MKRMVFFASALALTGCTATIKESRFIAQDDEKTLYSDTFINTLNAQTPRHNVNVISIPSEDKTTTLYGVFLDNQKTRNTVLYIPGNGMSVEKAATNTLLELAEYDYDIVIFDRRGLGASEGTATIANLINDANVTFDYTKQSLKADKVIVHGYSLGSFIAAQLAKNKAVDGLVMQGSATNVDDWVDEAMPWYSKVFVDVQIDDAFYSVDNKQVLSENYVGPLLVICGADDKQTPAILSEKLFNASTSAEKQLVIAENAGHGEMFNSKNVQVAYQTFLAKF
ncbi:alpha/beta fold hydrolase [Pseudoalteromonas sp. MMG024]|uniref:alpha/beta hydrolase n=1 Tax=Pseudoalteromonas sp. MMG024 TaxID=2909980 RepID=UPI001F2251F8|nr:alpha/beta fold hydrolase [Pseudoalteromonas sp. MMG024]MCF6456029.1 alpha/beta hydrolase [Pseudoalteromonas sp. MMG024]